MEILRKKLSKLMEVYELELEDVGAFADLDEALVKIKNALDKEEENASNMAQSEINQLRPRQET